MPTPAQAAEHRADLVALTTAAATELQAQFTDDFDSAEAARDFLIDWLPALLARFAPAAATLGADWYDDIRDGEGVRGRFRAVVPDIDVADLGVEELAGWATDPLFRPEPDWQAAHSLVEGGVQRRIVNASRDTITTSVLEDPQAVGWQRVGRGECGFCTMLISRGAVYTEATADFGAHDNCHCEAAPAFGGKPRAVKPYTPTSRNITDVDRARVREWLRANT